MELLLWIGGIAASGFFSWLFTHLYYRKALLRQAEESAAQLQKLTELVELGMQSAEARRQMLREKRIADCVLEYQRAGTPVALVDTYDDLSDAEKADLLDTVFMRAKGRKPKVNKYRARKTAAA
jgi:hypothetical protein